MSGTHKDEPDVRLVLTLEVDYFSNGVSIKELKNNLENLVRIGAGEGLFTGHSDAKTDRWDHRIETVDLTEHMKDGSHE